MNILSIAIWGPWSGCAPTWWEPCCPLSAMWRARYLTTIQRWPYPRHSRPERVTAPVRRRLSWQATLAIDRRLPGRYPHNTREVAMRITLLGTGTPIPEPKRQASALLVEIGEAKLLFDAGRGVTTQLAKVGIEPQQIDFVFITHHHYDHIGNLGEFLLTSWHNGRQARLWMSTVHLARLTSWPLYSDESTRETSPLPYSL